MPSVMLSVSSHSLHKSRVSTGTTTSLIAFSYAVIENDVWIFFNQIKIVPGIFKEELLLLLFRQKKMIRIEFYYTKHKANIVVRAVDSCEQNEYHITFWYAYRKVKKSMTFLSIYDYIFENTITALNVFEVGWNHGKT